MSNLEELEFNPGLFGGRGGGQEGVKGRPHIPKRQNVKSTMELGGPRGMSCDLNMCLSFKNLVLRLVPFFGLEMSTFNSNSTCRF